MVLLSNLFVLWFKPGKRWGLFYGLLIGTLTINALVPMDSYLGLSWNDEVSCRFIHFRLHPSLLRGHRLRDGISGQPSARYRYQFEYWWSDPWGPERISLIDDGFQLASRPRHLFLLALSPHGGAAVAGPAIGQDRAFRLLIRPLSVREAQNRVGHSPGVSKARGSEEEETGFRMAPMSRPIRQIARRMGSSFLPGQSPLFPWLSGCSSWSGDEADYSAIEGPSGTLRRGAMLLSSLYLYNNLHKYVYIISLSFARQLVLLDGCSSSVFSPCTRASCLCLIRSPKGRTRSWSDFG